MVVWPQTLSFFFAFASYEGTQILNSYTYLILAEKLLIELGLKRHNINNNDRYKSKFMVLLQIEFRMKFETSSHTC